VHNPKLEFIMTQRPPAPCAAGLLIIILILGLLHQKPVMAENFRAGFAKTNITPEVPMPLWGYGARKDMLSTGVRDSLYAKVLLLEVGDNRLALVGLDMGRSPIEQSMTRIIDKIQAFGVNHVFIVGSHTHHGPVIELKNQPGMGQGRFDDEVLNYPMILEDAIVDIIRRASENLQPARIGWNIESVDMNRNRHTAYEPKPRDSDLTVLRVDDISGNPLAILVNFAAHPTMLPVDDLRYSAEWPGRMMQRVEAALGVDCLFMQGAAGDLTVRRTERGSGSDGFGDALAQKVIEIAEKINTTVPEKPRIQAIMKTYDFPSRVDTRNESLLNVYRQAYFPELINALLPEFEESRVRAVLTVALINNELALVGGSGEFFSAHSVRLKERFHDTDLVFFGFSNGHHLYFPTIEGVAEGGYGADAQVAWVEVGAPEMMMNDALQLLYYMRGQMEPPK
jgi:neutral ceramidase